MYVIIFTPRPLYSRRKISVDFVIKTQAFPGLNQPKKIKKKYMKNVVARTTSDIKNSCYISPLQVVYEGIPVVGHTRYDAKEMYTDWSYSEQSVRG
jgi:hypothetical protein